MSNGAWEKWYNRILGAAVPAFLAYLLHQDARDGTIDSDILVIVLAGYGTGLAAAVVRKLVGMGRDDDRS